MESHYRFAHEKSPAWASWAFCVAFGYRLLRHNIKIIADPNISADPGSGTADVSAVNENPSIVAVPAAVPE